MLILSLPILNSKAQIVEISVTNGEYGDLNGKFYRTGSLLVYSFYLSFKKQYEVSSYDTILKMDSFIVDGRYDITSRYTNNKGQEKVVSVYIPDASDSFTLNLQNNPIEVGGYIFSSGVVAIKPK